MFATSELSRTLQGFTNLGLPGTLIQMILLCHRYLFVFQQEAARMQRAMRVRGFVPRTNLATLRDWPVLVTVVDITWGTVHGTLVSGGAYLIGTWLGRG